MTVGIRDFVPPIVGKIVRRIRQTVRLKEQELFNGDGGLFKQVAADCDVYGEYGMGASTRWVLANTRAKVMAVDTSKEWIDHVVRSNDDPSRLIVNWIDVGPLGGWGRPLSYTRKENFSSYAEAIWRGPDKPQLVLVDGRFRVFCFLQSLLSSEPGTSIIFDDYANRPHYHLVEELVKPSQTHGRQALFHTPQAFDREYAKMLHQRFMYVLE